MTVAAYPEYKESGVEWLGLMPAHWTARRISLLFDDIGSGTTPPGTGGDFYDGDINWVTTGELRESAIVETEKKITQSARDAFSTLRLYPAGTILIAMYGATTGRVGWLASPACTNQACCALANPQNVDTRFFYYCLLGAKDALILLSSGGGQPNINQEKIRAFRMPLPSRPEQAAIVTFLDRETGKIDALVEEQRRLIALLKEKRQAVISHAVTRGLNPNAPMKDSGIEWLGEVPAHWEVSPLKWLTPPDRAIMYGIVLPGPDVGKGIPIVKGGDVKPGRLSLDQLCWTTPEIETPFARARLRPNDIVYSIRGSIGDAELVPDALIDANITQDVARISPVEDVNFNWLLNVMRSQPIFVQLEQRSMGAAVRGINIFDLKRAQIPVPPRSEQNRIATFLEPDSKVYQA
jgi:type I restriction enzyme S subunit